VVKIASKDFNKELSGYIGRRKTGKGLFSKGIGIRIGGKKKQPAGKAAVTKAPGVQVEYKQPNFLSKLFSFRRGLIKEAGQSEDLGPEEMAKLRGMEDEIEDTEKEIVEKEEEVKDIREKEEVLVEKREGMLTKLFGKMNILKRKRMSQEAQEEPAENEVDEPALAEDVVEVIKIAHRWLNELPPGKKRSFKASSDFKKYKEVLEKYGLAREKKE
jgi:hypothetical protein